MQQVMGVKKLVALIECVLLLLTLLGVGFAEKEIRELLSGGQRISASEERDENSAQSLWAKCGLELSKLKEVSEDLGFSNLEISGITDGNTPKDEGSTEENVQKALSILHSLLGNNPFDCLKEEYVVFPVSGEEESHTIWYPRHVKSILSKMGKLVDLRRRLDHELLETATTAAPAATPSPPPSPRNSLHPPKRPARTPTPPPSPAPPPSLKPHASNSKSKTSKSSSRVPIVIAVVLTAAVTFFVSAVIFLCCRKAFHKSSGYEYKDDSPLLSLSLSDSAGSSGKSYVVDNSFKKMGSQSYDADFSHKNGTGALDGKSSVCNDIINGSAIGVDKFSEKITNTYIPSLPLKPPPGKIGASPPEMIPLKPPPGRVDPLPSEPPASLRPSPSKAGPPRPPLAPPSKTPSGVAPQPPPPPPPASSGSKPGPRPPPPPPPKIGGPPPHPPSTRKASGSAANGDVDEGSKTKLKPFFWDKVPANPDHSMVWHQIKSGSFQFNEEMIETLFGYNLPERRKNGEKKESSSHDPPSQLIQIIDSKKAQNLSILLRALNVTIEEACDALQEGNELPTELLDTLVKMAPTPEEELKLRLFSGDPSRLGPAERFLKVVIEIPFAFKRLEALLFMSTLQEEVSFVNESFTTLEVACRELRGSRLFLKLLEAVLKTGNRMNDGTFRGGANAFKLDTLLKLSDVRGTDGKTTLLHFVVQEIIRTEGVRATRELGESHSLSSVNSDDLLDDTADDAEDRYRSLGLQVVSGLGGQLENVKKAACLDADELNGNDFETQERADRNTGFSGL
ncbi:hypothetical protein Nepgr_026167 [Nepenthes gracilis]|uniref:Formin-like protein n=1 Tax=Nepenthes gracilis TaxID=150966 RepID=A0AAD3T7V2_NEPGR|nr:hypothetical protein Nepgr_026167 [Nepenthes gracilis]